LILKSLAVLLSEEVHENRKNREDQENIGFRPVTVPAQNRFYRENDRNDQVCDLKEFEVLGHDQGVSST
jgi:hypothetical protein